MNGKRAKQIRRAQGLSIQNRREQRVFDRQVNATIAGADERKARARRAKRLFFAWGAITVIVAAVLAALAAS